MKTDMQGETIPYSPTFFGWHSALTSCRASTLARKYEFVSELPQKSRPFLSEAGGTICRAKKRSFLSVSLILRRLNGTASNAGFLARFVARFLCLPGFPVAFFPSRAPLTAAGQHRPCTCFSAIEALFPISFYTQKAGGRAPSLALTDFFHIISE